MRLLYLAWLHGGHDPYRLFNMLDEGYRPLEPTEGDPPQHRPPDPRRLSQVVYGFAMLAFQEGEARTVRAMGGGTG
jgi:hypothetical protein